MPTSLFDWLFSTSALGRHPGFKITKKEKGKTRTRKNTKKTKQLLLLYLSFRPNSGEPERIIQISCSLRGFDSKRPITKCTQRRDDMASCCQLCGQQRAKTMGTGLISPPPPKLHSKQSQMSRSQKVEEENINLFQGKLRIACAWNT